jgi:hypothetical protein
MNDPLQQLLQAAEPASAEPPRSFVPDALLAAAHRRRLRHTATRSAVAVSVVVLVAAPLLTADWSSRTPDHPTHATSAHAPAAPNVPAADLDAIQQELARLEREAALHQQIVAAVLAPDPFEGPPVRLGLSDAELVRLETARNAALSLQYAEMAERELDDIEAARREFERVAERFPNTRWSAYAAISLQRLDDAAPTPNTL